VVQVVCEQLKIQSQNDTVKLAEAKQMVYLKVGGMSLGRVWHLVPTPAHLLLLGDLVL
jgi:hypothetical protein